MTDLLTRKTPDEQRDADARHALARLNARGREVLLALATDPSTVTFDERLCARSRPYIFTPPFGWAVLDTPWDFTPLGRAMLDLLKRAPDA